MSFSRLLPPFLRHYRPGFLLAILACLAFAAKLQAAAPAPPNNVSVGVSRIVTGVSEQQLFLIRWTDRSLDESYFIIQYRLGLSGPFYSVYLSNPDVEAEGINLGVAFNPGSLVEFRVVAIKDPTTGQGQILNGDEEYFIPPNTSSQGSVTIPTSITFGAPANLSASVTGDALLRLSWLDNCTTEEAFEVQYKRTSDPDTAYSTLFYPTFEQNPVETIAGLIPSQSYHLRIRALRAGTTTTNGTTYAQQTAFSSPVVVVIPALSPPTQFVITSLAEDVVRLNWNDNSYNEGDFNKPSTSSADQGGYVVLQRTAGTSGSFIELGNVSPNVEQVNNLSVIPGRALDWQVKARHRNASTIVDSAASNIVTFTPPFHRPTQVTAVLSGRTSVNVTWKDNSAVESGYVVEGRQGAGAFSTLATVAAGVQKAVVTLPAAQTTEIRVRAFYTQSNTDYFSQASDSATVAVPNQFTSRAWHPAVKGTPISPYPATVGSAPSRTSWNMVSGPAWASFDTETGLLTGTPAQSGIQIAKLGATFSDGSSDSLDVVFRVQEPEAAPEIQNGAASRSIPVGVPVVIPLTEVFRDPDSPSAVQVNTTTGSFPIILLDQLTPQTVANFMSYVNGGDYAGVAVHRAIPGFVVQMGGFKPTAAASPDNNFTTVTERPSPRNEPGVSNVRRTVAMAKKGGDPHSATHDFFVNVADNSANLDGQNEGFTVFGRIPESAMSVPDALVGGGIHRGSYNIQVPSGSGTVTQTLDDFPLTSVNTLPTGTNGYQPVDKNLLVRVNAVSPTATLFFSGLTNSDPGNVTAALSGTNLELTGINDATSSNIEVTATDLDGTSTTYSFTVNVDAAFLAPSITSQPVGGTINGGGAQTFEVQATGTSLTYQWRKNGVNIPGANGVSLTISDASFADQATYQVLVSNAATIVPSNAVTLTVNTVPEVTSHPVALTRSYGGSAQFSVTAAGPGTLAYQWKKNGEPVDGAIASSFILPWLVMSDAADYTCTVSNAFGSSTSNAAALTVTATDQDGDGLPDHEELARETDRFDEDTDDDGYSDAIEVDYSTNPKNAGSTPASVQVVAKVERTSILRSVAMRPLPAKTGFPNGLGMPATVDIPQMWLSTYELTNAQWAAILQHAKDEMTGVINIVDNMGQKEVHSRGNLVCRLPTHQATAPGNLGIDEVRLSEDGDTFMVSKTVAEHPVRGVSWHGAYLAAEVMNHFHGYATKMNIGSLSFNFPDQGFHIPRHFEWEYAARSGTTSQIYPTGATISSTKANYEATAFGKPKPVNSHVANALIGCFNLAGNVSEWIFEEDSTVSGNGFTRGGGYDDLEAELRNDEEMSRPKGVLNGSVGIRLALVDARAPASPTHPEPYVIVRTGSPITLTAGAVGAPPIALQWFRDNKLLPGKTAPTLVIPAATLGDAGAYHAVISNSLGSLKTNGSIVTVVDAAPKTLYVKLGSSATLSATSKGSSILGHNWRKDGTDVDETAGLLEGVNTPKLKVFGPTDQSTGSYDCQVTGPGVSGVVTTGQMQVVFVEKPVVGQPSSIPAVAVGGSFSMAPLFDTALNRTPAKWTVTGLPPGMTFNPLTGLISGRPTKPGTYNVKVTASNVAGSSNTETYRISVEAFPSGALGDFVGSIAPGTTSADDLGGRIDFKTTTVGTFTGSVVLEGVRHAISGTLNTDSISSASVASTAKVRATFNVLRTGAPTIQFSLVLDPATNGLSGTAGPLVPPATAPVDANKLSVTGWRNKWSGSTIAANNPRSGKQNFHLGIPAIELNDPTIPQGKGFATITVALKGATTVSGRAADGSVISSSGYLGPDGQVLLFQAPYGSKGSLLGTLSVGATATQGVTGTVRWFKKGLGAASTDRNYKDGFGPLSLTAAGLAYSAPPAGQLVVSIPTGTDNAKVTFAPLRLDGMGTALEGTVTAAFTINSNHKTTLPAAMPQITLLSLVITPGTGSFTGKVRIVDTGIGMPPSDVTREATFNGLFVKDPVVGTPGFGEGYVLFPHLPNLPTSPYLSARVTIQKTP